MHDKHRNAFAKYGHNDCSMVEEMDVVWKKYPGETTCAKIKRFWVSLFIVSEDMCRSISSHLKSHGAVIKEQKRQLNQSRCIIHPYSKFRFHWDFVMIVVSYIQLIAMPFDVMFYLLPLAFSISNSLWFTWMRMGMDLTCVLDVILNFFTGYYDESKKRVRFSRGPIAVHYLKGEFTIDFLASLPTHIDLFIVLKRESTAMVVLGWLSMLKILRYVVLEKLYTKVCNIKRVNYYVRQAVFIVVSVSLFWLFLTALNRFSSESLRTEQQRRKRLKWDEGGLPKKYKNDILADYFYRGARLMYNLSHSYSMDPQTFKTVLLTIFFWIISRLVLIYILAKVMDLVIAGTAASRKYQRIILLLSEFMRHKGLPLTTQTKVIQFYEYHFQKGFYNEKEIMMTISGQLRQELVMHNCRLLVENVKFFKSLPLVVLVRIVSFLHSETYMTNDVICRCNTVGNCMYFIAAGTVAVYTKSGKEICHLHDGDYFGEVALVTDSTIRVATVLAVEVCEVYRLERADFVKAIHPYPDLLQIIKKIALERREDALEIDVKYRRQNDGD